MAMAWESLVEVHVVNALRLIALLRRTVPLETSLMRYIDEMDLAGPMANGVRTRALARIDASDARDEADQAPPLQSGRDDDTDADGAEGWRRFRPDVVMRGVRQRQRRAGEIDGWIQLAIARAEEAVMTTHVDNAITFAALLEEHLPLTGAVQHYIDAAGLAGGRAQAVFQRTMARLAEVHLPRMPHDSS